MADKLIIETEDLGVLELAFETLEVDITHDNGREEHRTCRIFSLPRVNGVEFETFATTDLLDQWAEDNSFCRELQLLVWLHMVLPNKDRRKARTFDPKTFERSESLRSLTAVTRTKDATLPERLLAIAGGGKAHNVALFDGAAYERPFIQVPLIEGEYEQFRQLALDELAEMRNQLNCTVNEAVDAIIRKESKRRGEKRLTQQQLAEAVAALDNTEFWNSAGTIIRKIMSKVLDETVQQEELRAERFRDLVEQIDDIRSRLEEEIERCGVCTTVYAEEGTVMMTAEFVSLLERVLPVEAANELLGDMLRRIEEDYQLTPLGVVDLDEYSDTAIVAGAGLAEPGKTEVPEFSVYEQYQQALSLAIAGNKVFGKWWTLCQMRAQIVNRTECMRLFQRESELAYSTAYGLAARVVYQRVRKYLSREERRAFQLLYLPTRWLNGRVAALEGLAWSFALEMDDETQGLLYMVLIRKAEDRAARDELGRRWNAFLRFYPHWLDMVRDDEREDRRRRSDRNPTEPFADNTTRDPKVVSPDIARQFSAVTSERLSEWCARYCTSVQAAYLVAYYRDGLTESAIGRANNVTQQAVSKGIKEGLKRLRAGLRKDRVVELDDE